MEYVIGLLEQNLIKMVYTVLIILCLTYLQSLHYIFLKTIISKSIFPIKRTFRIISRIGIIIHEFSHIIFIFLSGGNIKSIQLFRADGGQVTYTEKDYIGSAAYHNYDGITYFLFMLASKIGFFLAQLGPLIIGILINVIVLNLLFDIPLFSNNFAIQLNNLNIYNILISLVYLIAFVPTFIPSWKDLSNIVFYHGKNIFENIFGTIINGFFLIIFIFIMGYFLDYLLYFFYFYLICLGITFILYISTRIYSFFKHN